MKNYQDSKCVIQRNSYRMHPIEYLFNKENLIGLSKLAVLSVFLIFVLISCSKSYSGKKYAAESSSLYIKFISSNTLEWKWDERFRPEEFEYTIEGNKIRTVRKLLGLGQIEYIDILDDDKLKDSDGETYLLE